MRCVVLLVISSLFASSTAHQKWNHGKMVMCPIFTQSVCDSLNIDFKYESIDFNMCTHLIYYDDEITHIEGVTDSQGYEDVIKILAIKEKYPNLKIFWAADNIWFSVKRFEKYEDFYGTFIGLVKSQKVDGIDVNFPNLNTDLLNSSEKDKVYEMLKEVRERLKRENVAMMSSFVLTLDDPQFDITDFLKYSQHFDYIQFKELVIADKFRKSSFEQILSEIKPANMQMKIERFIEWGVPPGKILSGVDFGGPAAVGEAKTVELSSYAYVCYIMMHDKPPKTMHLYDDDTELATLNFVDEENMKSKIYYSSTRTNANHMRFIVKRNLAGVYTDLLQNDDVEGICPMESDTFDDFKPVEGITLNIPERKKEPLLLLRTINTALTVAAEELEQLKKMQPSQISASDKNQSDGAAGGDQNDSDEEDFNSVIVTDDTINGATPIFKQTSFYLAFLVIAIGLTSVIVWHQFF